MKKLLITVLTISIAVLASCAAKEPTDSKNDTTTTTVKTEQTTLSDSDETTAAKSDEASDIHRLADAALAAANFDEAPSLVFKADEYSDDVLMFAYGVEENTEAVSDFVLSEAPSRSANTVAYLVFADGTSADVIANVRTQIENYYITSLKSALEMYNPEAFALCDKAVFKEYDNALLLVIAENADAVVSAVENAR